MIKNLKLMCMQIHKYNLNAINQQYTNEMDFVTIIKKKK